MHFTCKIQTPLGEMLAASDGSALTGLWFEGQKHFAAGLNLPGEAKKLPLFDEVKRQALAEAGARPDGTTLPVALRFGFTAAAELYRF